MIQLNFERADKKMLDCDKLKIVTANEQVFCTDGANIDVRLVAYDECYVNFQGVMELMDSNTFGEKETLETILVKCTTRVVKNADHAWSKFYTQILKTRVNASFEFYFKVLEQYMLANQPHVNKIGPIVNKLVITAEQYKQCNNFYALYAAYHAFDKASALMVQHMYSDLN